MHRTRTLVILGLVTLAVLAAAYFARQPGSGTDSGAQAGLRAGGALLPGLMDRLNEVTEIALLSQEESFTLKRQGDEWLVPQRAGYPAAAEQVRGLLLGLAQLERVEPKTRNPDHYEKLGLTDPTADDSEALQITVRAGAHQPVADIIVGRRRPGRGAGADSGYFVRLPGDPQSWLVEGKLPVQKQAPEWLDKGIVELDRVRIREVRVTHADGERVAVRRDDPSASDYTLVEKPAEATLTSAYAVNSIATSLASLSLEDVRAAEEVSFGDTPELAVELTTFDGLRIGMETTASEDGEGSFARLRAAFDATLVEGSDDTTAAETEDESMATQDPAPQSPDPAAVQAEAEGLNTRWEKWAYRLPSYRLSNVSKRMADLIEAPTDADALDTTEGAGLPAEEEPEIEETPPDTQ